MGQLSKSIISQLDKFDTNTHAQLLHTNTTQMDGGDARTSSIKENK